MSEQPDEIARRFEGQVNGPEAPSPRMTTAAATLFAAAAVVALACIALVGAVMMGVI